MVSGSLRHTYPKGTTSDVYRNHVHRSEHPIAMIEEGIVRDKTIAVPCTSVPSPRSSR